MNKALVGIMKFVVSDLQQEDILFVKRNPELSDEESKWDVNFDGIKELFNKLSGAEKLNKKFIDPRKSKNEIAKEYFMNSNFKKMRKNKITRKEKIVNDLCNYFFIYAFENGIKEFNDDNCSLFWDSFYAHMNDYLENMKIKYNIK